MPSIRRYRAQLESLESRTVLSTVTNLMDAGTGSLRQAIADTPAAGTVDFDPGLSGTITLTTGQLMLTRNLILTGPGVDAIMVSGGNRRR